MAHRWLGGIAWQGQGEAELDFRVWEDWCGGAFWQEACVEVGHVAEPTEGKVWPRLAPFWGQRGGGRLIGAVQL